MPRNAILPVLALRDGLPQVGPGELVARVLDAFGDEARDPRTLLRQLHWGIRESYLGADVGGQDALLVPRSKGGFDVVVDPRLSATQLWMTTRCDRGSLASSAVRFRVAHEIAHSFFYVAASPPRRRCRMTEVEEAFCDQFAAALLVGESKARTAADLVRLGSRLDGNLELAAHRMTVTQDVEVTVRCDGVTVLRLGAGRSAVSAETTAVKGRVRVSVAA